MRKDLFLQAIQSRTARVAVGASAVRGRGNAGAVAASRAYLRRLDLARLVVEDPRAFQTELDRATNKLRLALPRNAQHWGLARKILNIFLRDCLYTSYLSDAFQLRRTERLLELPLDSITAKKLRQATGPGWLPLWPGVKHLTPAISARFQEAAAHAADMQEISRVHLDAVWWSASRDEDAA